MILFQMALSWMDKTSRITKAELYSFIKSNNPDVDDLPD